jgi:catechol 2,3-dioxygenase-like lactoylglutathione lyase family enzyme
LYGGQYHGTIPFHIEGQKEQNGHVSFTRWQMNLKFINTIFFVRDIGVSKTFYAETLGIKIIGDYGAFVLFENHLAIHQARELAVTVWKADAPSGTDQPQGRHNVLVYFETDTLEDAFARLKNQVRLIHPIERQAWGQNVFRFYDPDGHVVEIGELL